MKPSKTFLYNIIVGDFYLFRVFKIEDAAHQVYYVGERTNRGGTVIADMEEDIRPKLEAQVPLINRFLEKTK